VLLWLVAGVSLAPFPPALGVIGGGVIVMTGIILITTSI
jgi:hypothetical protein